MAGDPVLVPLLLGLGVDELSVAPATAPRIKHLVRRCRLADAEELARWALTQASGQPILARAEELARSIDPAFFDSALSRPPGPETT